MSLRNENNKTDKSVRGLQRRRTLGLKTATSRTYVATPFKKHTLVDSELPDLSLSEIFVLKKDKRKRDSDSDSDQFDPDTIPFTQEIDIDSDMPPSNEKQEEVTERRQCLLADTDSDTPTEEFSGSNSDSDSDSETKYNPSGSEFDKDFDEKVIKLEKGILLKEKVKQFDFHRFYNNACNFFSQLEEETLEEYVEEGFHGDSRMIVTCIRDSHYSIRTRKLYHYYTTNIIMDSYNQGIRVDEKKLK